MFQRFIHDDKENADPNGLPEVPDFSDIPDLMELIEEPSGGVLSDDDGTVILDEFFQTGITEELQNWITDEYSESDEYLYEDPGNQNNLPELNEKISEETRLFKNRDFTCSDDLSKFCVEGPPEPTIIPVISLDTSPSSKPESLIASFIAI